MSFILDLKTGTGWYECGGPGSKEWVEWNVVRRSKGVGRRNSVRSMVRRGVYAIREKTKSQIQGTGLMGRS